MDLTNKEILISILSKNKIYLKKSLGQNFLINRNIVEKIIEHGELGKEDLVLEIGAGIGTLTIELAKYSKRVIAVEIDKRFEKILKEFTKEFNNVEIIIDDILKINIDSIIEKPFKIFGNLPYYLSGSFLGEYLKKGPYADLMILMLQKEMAERLISKPGNKRFSPLSLLLQLTYKVEIICPVPSHFFFPIPEVDSLLLKFKYSPSLDKIKNKEIFFKVIRSAFKYRRKFLLNNLKREFPSYPLEEFFKKLNIDLKERAENLPLEKYIDLSNYLLEYDAKNLLLC
ncbi:MAG: 16S rRNA (adenine(1518)-N(6)/adenine(1519)-N(6))-dimethyltransferase RsmA [Dictyoglomus sp.]|nr:16S rRNA (adenine(1518)-N(6)/adenine(1519)-N(6))-dimethyltransferase RsmA [Dictyoglomus sp.]MCX7942000.1 16S rRNA (adenine(1518)-N(6)/adenine(1519)-N(6))-dimethyltransferase RsmA [Dictyoglomaceae bacterium]MDW8188738.1 16S rRNA (adenine(1518)-N(6)/adenine(1519)-N(6))-dimethyltransferase RsmA [Dictyoglomus sp.]